MNTPFGVPWETLAFSDLTTFFDDRPDEGLTWEAKGGDIRPNHVRIAACAFANSELGGFLVLGATRDKVDSSWHLGGWQPKDEPDLWVANCLGHGGVSPRPSFEVVSWPVGGGSDQVAVVAIRPVAVPPAITAGGEVWQRVSGSSQRIADPTILAQLFERGRAAESRARASADAGVRGLTATDPAGRETAFAIGLATSALPSDVSLRLFRKSVADRFAEVLRGRLRGESLALQYSRHTLEVDQWTLRGTSASAFGNGAEGFALWISSDGALGGSRADPDAVGEAVAIIGAQPDQLVPIWETLVALAHELGAPADSPAFVTVWLSSKSLGFVQIRRRTALRTPTEEELASIAREAHRARGSPAWEQEQQ